MNEKACVALEGVGTRLRTTRKSKTEGTIAEEAGVGEEERDGGGERERKKKQGEKRMEERRKGERAGEERN